MLPPEIDPSELATIGVPQPLPPRSPARLAEQTTLPPIVRGPSTHEALAAIRANRGWLAVGAAALSAVVALSLLLTAGPTGHRGAGPDAITPPPLLAVVPGDEFAAFPTEGRRNADVAPPPLPLRAYAEPASAEPHAPQRAERAISPPAPVEARPERTRRPKPVPVSREADLLDAWQ